MKWKIGGLGARLYESASLPKYAGDVEMLEVAGGNHLYRFPQRAAAIRLNSASSSSVQNEFLG